MILMKEVWDLKSSNAFAALVCSDELNRILSFALIPIIRSGSVKSESYLSYLVGTRCNCIVVDASTILLSKKSGIHGQCEELNFHTS